MVQWWHSAKVSWHGSVVCIHCLCKIAVKINNTNENKWRRRMFNAFLSAPFDPLTTYDPKLLLLMTLTNLRKRAYEMCSIRNKIISRNNHEKISFKILKHSNCKVWKKNYTKNLYTWRRMSNLVKNERTKKSIMKRTKMKVIPY